MIDTRTAGNGSQATQDDLDAFRARIDTDLEKRAHEAPRGLRTPTERRNALEDTLGFAAQEADALANYYANVAKQLRLLAQQVALPESPTQDHSDRAERSADSEGTAVWDPHGELYEHARRTPDN